MCVSSVLASGMGTCVMFDKVCGVHRLPGLVCVLVCQCAANVCLPNSQVQCMCARGVLNEKNSMADVFFMALVSSLVSQFLFRHQFMCR